MNIAGIDLYEIMNNLEQLKLGNFTTSFEIDKLIITVSYSIDNIDFKGVNQFYIKTQFSINKTEICEIVLLFNSFENVLKIMSFQKKQSDIIMPKYLCSKCLFQMFKILNLNNTKIILIADGVEKCQNKNINKLVSYYEKLGFQIDTSYKIDPNDDGVYMIANINDLE